MSLTKLSFTCTTVTPMFSAGANPKDQEFRIPEIKAALRFWWRASRANYSLEQLRKEEAKIFGGVEREEGKSIFSLNLREAKCLPFDQSKWDNLVREKEYMLLTQHQGKTIHFNLFDYLAYGTVVTYHKEMKKNMLDRKGYAPNSSFIVDVLFRNENKDLLREVQKALTLFHFFGTVGTKSRNGFGKIYLDPFPGEGDQNTIEKVFLETKKKSPPSASYTAFTQNSRLFKTKTNYSSWHRALFEIGKVYRAARLSLEKHHSYELRQLLAAPIITKNRQESRLGRHAKQYFLLVLPEENNFRGYILHLPYDYHIERKHFAEYQTAYTKMNNHFLSILDEVR